MKTHKHTTTSGTKPKGTQPRSASSSSSSLFQAPPSGSPDVTLTYKKCTPVATTATTEGSQTISPSPATATAHGPLFSAMLAAVATPPASPAPQQGTHDTTQTGPVPSGIGSTTTNTGTTTDRQQQGGCSSSDANHRRMSGASAGGVCTVGSEKKEESGGFGALPPRPPLLMPAPSPIEVGVVVQPLQMLYQPRFLESIAGECCQLYAQLYALNYMWCVILGVVWLCSRSRCCANACAITHVFSHTHTLKNMHIYSHAMKCRRLWGTIHGGSPRRASAAQPV